MKYIYSEWWFLENGNPDWKISGLMPWVRMGLYIHRGTSQSYFYPEVTEAEIAFVSLQLLGAGAIEVGNLG